MNDDDIEILFDYELGTGSTATTPYTDVQFRYNTSTGERLMARFASNHTALYGWNGSAWTLLKIAYSMGSTLGTEYHARVVADGADVKMYRWTDGTAETLIIHETAAPLYNGNHLRFFARPNTENYFDNIRILADSLSQTVTYTYNSNNELATMADYNGTTTYTYDDWGRTTSKARGTQNVEYKWAYDNKLRQVDAKDWPEQGERVTYHYRGDGKRHSRSQWVTNPLAPTEYTLYHYGPGFGVTNEENALASNTDVKTYVAGLGEASGTDTTLGAMASVTRDHLGSVRGQFDASENAIGTREFTPYGTTYLDDLGGAVTAGFTGHQLDGLTGDYFAPFRYYAPEAARWLKRDPIHMFDGPNMYAYVGGRAVSYFDPLGLDAVYLLDGNAVAGAGHTGGLFGNDKNGWVYFSFALGSAIPLTGAQDNLTVLRFKTFDEASKDPRLARYELYARWKTDGAQDKKAIQAISKYFNKNYSLFRRNCDDVILAGFSAAGVKLKDELRPVATYSANKKNADESGTFYEPPKLPKAGKKKP